MRAVFFAPHGFAGQELGAAMVSAKMLESGLESKVFLSCDGAHSICGRDALRSWERKLTHCSSCGSEQETVRSWLGWESRSLGGYISLEQQVASSRMLRTLNAKELERFEYLGIPLATIVRPFVTQMIKRDPANPKLKEDSYRRVLLSSLRFLFQLETFFAEQEPQLVFSTGLDDFMNSVLAGVCQRLNVQQLRFSWVPGQRHVSVQHPVTGVAIPCEVLLEHINSIPADSSAWGTELVELVADLLARVGLAPGFMSSSQLGLKLSGS